jgi:hypothetical protein
VSPGLVNKASPPKQLKNFTVLDQKSSGNRAFFIFTAMLANLYSLPNPPPARVSSPFRPRGLKQKSVHVVRIISHINFSSATDLSPIEPMPV